MHPMKRQRQKDVRRDAGRSHARITTGDLERLAKIAEEDRKEYVDNHPKRAPLKRRILAVALCQGAALHFLNNANGIKDFDVWTFYTARPSLSYPPRRITHRDFGGPKFGRSPNWNHFVGRRVDLLGRSIASRTGESCLIAIRRYLSNGRTESARRLAEKAVILLEPKAMRGQVVWPIDVKSFQRTRASMEKFNHQNKNSLRPLRFLAKRRDALVGTTERQIERMLQLPAGCVRLVLPGGRKARGDKKIGSLLRDYGW